MNSINHNLMAANVANNLNSHYGRLAVSVERLSSGLRLNSAADDAAGLAIRELMRADVATLNQGVRNANDAISMLQVADGALGIIDEKLIRMKELAEQAATGTYDSTQRLMIDSEFQEMGAEIDRIARSTEFNGIHLLDGSLSGTHDGSGLNASGKMKIHFGTANDSAEDYYYVEIGDCSTSGLGLRGAQYSGNNTFSFRQILPAANSTAVTKIPFSSLAEAYATQQAGYCFDKITLAIDDTLSNPDATIMDGLYDPVYQDNWWVVSGGSYFRIPKGTKNIVITMCSRGELERAQDDLREQNLVLYGSATGQQLVGPVTGDPDLPFHNERNHLIVELITGKPYGNASLYMGPSQTAANDLDNLELGQLKYHDMKIYYSGPAYTAIHPPVNGVAVPNNPGYEVLMIDEAKEELILGVDGYSNSRSFVKATWGGPDFNDPEINLAAESEIANMTGSEAMIDIKTQERAQQALERIDDAIVAKDKVRAHLGALQNRLENTLTNITIQGENLQAAESRISDTDVAREMTTFVRNQVLTQSAIAMLGQANSYPHMLAGLLNG